jgi:hypothetical protein
MPGMSPVDGGTPPCLAEFLAKLREEKEKRGGIAMARHATREEMCMHMSYVAEFQTKWIKFVETAVQTCSSIPPQVVNQLDQMKQLHASIERSRVRVCAASPRMMHMDDFPRDDHGE